MVEYYKIRKGGPITSLEKVNDVATSQLGDANPLVHAPSLPDIFEDLGETIRRDELEDLSGSVLVRRLRKGVGYSVLRPHVPPEAEYQAVRLKPEEIELVFEIQGVFRDMLKKGAHRSVYQMLERVKTAKDKADFLGGIRKIPADECEILLDIVAGMRKGTNPLIENGSIKEAFAKDIIKIARVRTEQ